VFVLFIANRYSIVPYLIWSGVALYGYTTSFCRDTRWLWFAYAAEVVFLAKITIALRIYAVTERNRWVGGALSSIIVAQSVFGIYSTVMSAMSPIQQLPDINLEPFKICIFQPSRLRELVFVNVGVAFDALAFLIIFMAAKKPRYPGIPSILDVILRDATASFALLFSFEIIANFFIIFAPKSPIPSAITVLAPIMSSRMMLSLKKASMGPTRAWSLSTMSNARQAGWVDGTICFALQAPGGLHDVPGASPDFVEEGIELESGSQLSLKDDLSLSS